MNDIAPYMMPITKAIAYSGLGRRVFDRHIRPQLVIVQVGQVSYVYRSDLEAAADALPELLCENTEHPASSGATKTAVNGASTSDTSGSEFDAILARVKQSKPSRGSRTKCNKSEPQESTAKPAHAAGKNAVRGISKSVPERQA